MNYGEIEAACCIWEHVLTNSFEGDNVLMDWLRAGEGQAVARSHCIDLAPLCDTSYNEAVAAGYDDSFDWEFVPTWLYDIHLVYSDGLPGDLDEEAAKEIGGQIGHNWREARDPRPPTK